MAFSRLELATLGLWRRRRLERRGEEAWARIVIILKALSKGRPVCVCKRLERGLL